jgi:hypothetical protein
VALATCYVRLLTLDACCCTDRVSLTTEGGSCCLAFPPEHAVLLCVKAGHAFVYAVPAGEEPQAPSFSFPLSSCGAAADPKRWGASGWGVALENKRGEPEYSVVFEKEADAEAFRELVNSAAPEPGSGAGARVSVRGKRASILYAEAVAASAGQQQPGRPNAL